MMRRFTAILTICAAAFFVGACSGGDSSPDVTTLPLNPTSTTLVGGPSSTDTGQTPESSTTTVVPEPPSGPAVLAVDGVAPIVLTTESGSGTRPLLTWESVPGADSYAVFVFNAEGAPYWAGETVENHLVLGGAVVPEAAGGPRIGDGYSWMVYAVDAEGLLITSSELGVLSP